MDNFDEVINRRHTNSIKWDYTDIVFGTEEELLPLWVADMDFKTDSSIVEAIKERAEHGIFGYAGKPDSYLEAIADWQERRHNWKIEKEWLVYSPGVVPSLSFSILAFTEPGDAVLVQSPVYYPFFSVVTNHNRRLVINRLTKKNNSFAIDWEDLEQKLQTENIKMLLLCSPHNPAGRVWKKEELMRLAALCIEYNVVVVSDEIHSDLVLKEHTHTPFASLSEEIRERTITCISPTKTFNLSGIPASSVVIPNERLRTQFQHVVNKLGVGVTNLFAIVATEAAYSKGEKWLEEVLEYIEGNYQYVCQFFMEHFPAVKVMNLEGTYLALLDYGSLSLSKQEMEELLLKKAKVAFQDGSLFGEGGEGLLRVNIACPRATLKEAVERFIQAMKDTK
ncbi:MalY/PatB family protein [Bacillus sp. 165]|uniref:MalY/PatB family protein n=1 Tax=Bacillus sp. 165 TaxID=1529117 RepID=UPI001ADAE6CC|nr:MalY/PatB family protein [Bacillus sp. 165]MBO9129123.1 pyridoxal phosphate-dependent aminotransferase [Bacillus sp. 165]